MKSATTTTTVQPTERYAFTDLTDDLRRAIKDSGVTDGAAVAFCAHTTCVLVINEWEDGAIEDFQKRITDLVPEDHYYAHDDHDRRTQNLNEDERVNGHSHVKAMLMSTTSHAIPVIAYDPVCDGYGVVLVLPADRDVPPRRPPLPRTSE